MLLFVYTTTHKSFVIFTCRYFKLSWNTTALSQSDCRNFSCSSISIEINLCRALKLKDYILIFPVHCNAEFWSLSSKINCLVTFFLTLYVPIVTNSNFLLTISIHYHEMRLWELIKWSPKRKYFDLLSNSLNSFFKEMYRDQFGEFVCGYWVLKG